MNATASANYALGKLAGSFSADAVPHTEGLLLRRDAIAAARIEGYRVTVGELLTTEATGVVPNRGTQIALNYVRAFEYACARLEELPLSLRLMRELHSLLLDGIAGTGSTPGHFRRSQNWIGPAGSTPATAVFVPPPIDDMNTLLHNWENYLHDESPLPSLVRLSLVHYQFAVIHPFLTMNETVGLLFAPLYLRHMAPKACPTLFIGHFLQRQSADFYYRLIEVCQRGNWEDWLSFYLYGMADSANDAGDCLHRLQQLHDSHRQNISTQGVSQSPSESLDLMYQRPVISTDAAAAMLGVPPDEAERELALLEDAGVVTRISSAQCSLWVAQSIVSALETVPARMESYRPFF